MRTYSSAHRPPVTPHLNLAHGDVGAGTGFALRESDLILRLGLLRSNIHSDAGARVPNKSVDSLNGFVLICSSCTFLHVTVTSGERKCLK